MTSEAQITPMDDAIPQRVAEHDALSIELGVREQATH